MIDRALLHLLALRHAPFVAACALLLAAFEYLICTAVFAANVSGALQAIIDSLPPLMQNLVATQFLGGLSERGLLAFGWNHPIAHALGTAPAIVLGARAVAGECEMGTLELLLAQPFSRGRYLATQACFALLALALLALVGVAGTLVGLRVQQQSPFAVPRLLGVGGNFVLLLWAWYAVTLALSAGMREGGRAAGIAFLLALLSYTGQVIGRVWPAASFLLPWTLHDYYSPPALLLGAASLARPALVLGAVTAGGLGLGAWRFRRRDVP